MSVLLAVDVWVEKSWLAICGFVLPSFIERICLEDHAREVHLPCACLTGSWTNYPSFYLRVFELGYDTVDFMNAIEKFLHFKIR